ncbi:MAG TPA: DivIVA domain-containing protein [Acidimicrobiia bacterium]|nr:DivIVA domain-containing protein [Acidimicrobiia bacterium]
MLTPADVEQKTFSTALRGYDLDEVDDFLDEIVATIKDLNEQLNEARAAARATTTSAPQPEPQAAVEPEAAQPESAIVEAPAGIDESAIGRALVAAQTAADRLVEEAESEAERILEEARSDADSWSEEREAKRREAEAEITALTTRVAAVRSELAVLAGEVSEKLDDMEAVIERSGQELTAEASVIEAEVGDSDHSADWVDSVDSADSFDSPDDQGGDHLDEILTGVATDLQLHSDDHPTEGDDDYPEPPDEDE